MRWLPAALVIAGCSNQPSVHTTADNVCDQIATVLCYDMSQCCGDAQLAQLLGFPAKPTGAECHAAIVQRCTIAIAPDQLSVAAGNVRFDGSRMDGCLTAMEVDDSCDANGPPWAEACAQSPWVGTLMADAICDNPNECREGLACLARTCQAQGQLGFPCNIPTDCAPGLTCDGTMCVGPGPVGATCVSDSACLSGKCHPGTCTQSGMACFGGQCAYCMISKVPCPNLGCPVNDTCVTEGCLDNACVANDTDYCTGPLHTLGLDH